VSNSSLNFLNYCVQPAIMHGGPSGQMWFVATPVPPSYYGNLSSDPDVANVGSSYMNVIGLTYSSLQSISTSSFQPYSVNLSIPFYPNSVTAKQPGNTGVSLDVNDTRMLKAEWESNRLVCTNTVGLVNGATDSAVGWYEFSTANSSAPVCTQEGFLPGPSGTSTFFPSIAIAPDGDLGMTYLESSPSEYLSMYVTGQPVSQYRVTNASGYDKMEPPQLVVQSVGPYNVRNPAKPSTARLGDFSNVTADPVTGDFWAANEWTAEAPGTPQQTDIWDTQVAHFSLFPSVSATQNIHGDPVTFIISANDGTLWEYDRDFTPGSGANPYCQQISTGQFSAISATRDASGNPVVFAIISGTHVAGVTSSYQTLYEYDPAFSGTHWVVVSQGTFGSISATRDASGRPEVFATIAAEHDPATGSTLAYSQTLWFYHDIASPGQGTWLQSSNLPWAAISATTDAVGNPVAFAISAPTDGTMTQSLWEYDPAFSGSHVNQISTGLFASIAATRDGTNNPVVFGILNTPGTYSYTLWKWASGGWTDLSISGFNQFSSLSATQDGSTNTPVLFAVAYGTQSPQHPNGQTLDYDNGTWTEMSAAENTTVSATRDASGNRVAFTVQTNDQILENDPALGGWLYIWTQQWS
jgi:hypothetical protein